MSQLDLCEIDIITLYKFIQQMTFNSPRKITVFKTQTPERNIAVKSIKKWVITSSHISNARAL